jgi:hypothetical protein
LLFLVPNIREFWWPAIWPCATAAAAPELSSIISNSRETLTSMAIPRERTRFYARLRSRRISKGLVELVRDTLPDGEPRTIVFEKVEYPGQTDVEFPAALVRRSDPGRLTVVICTGEAGVSDDELRGVLDDRARLQSDAITKEGSASSATRARRSRAEGRALAWRYISSDCTSDDAQLRRAYMELHPADRAQLHARRAQGLSERAEPSPGLRAIPGRGLDPGAR